MYIIYTFSRFLSIYIYIYIHIYIYIYIYIYICNGDTLSVTLLFINKNVVMHINAFFS